MATDADSSSESGHIKMLYALMTVSSTRFSAYVFCICTFNSLIDSMSDNQSNTRLEQASGTLKVVTTRVDLSLESHLYVLA